MSKMSKAAQAKQEVDELRLNETEVNFMGGLSYTINPLDTLKMITASSIYGEPSYYIDSNTNKKTLSKAVFRIDRLIDDCFIPEQYVGKTTNVIMEEATDAALSYDFAATLEWAVKLRNEFNMRLNPQMIMVRAALHPGRKAFTEAHPGEFDRINQEIMLRPDEPMSQMAYYIYKNGKKNGMPSVLKRSWANKLSKLSRKNIAKYKNHEIGMINAVRICHASSAPIDELMKNGTIEVDTDEKTWENLRSEGKSWVEIFNTIDMGHMALLRNLRGVFTEVEDLEFCKKYLEKLKNGVATGKQFPFRYYAAMTAVENSSVHHKQVILDALEDCFDLAMVNYPKLKGKTMCLSDNSGSAWSTMPSEYGTVTIAEIDNISSVITAAASEEGYVGKFGTRLKKVPVSKRQGLLNQAKQISKGRGDDVGAGTEGGIWEFFKKAIANKEHWDNIFIYSDMQAGHGGLYGETFQSEEYKKAGFAADTGWGYSYINVYALIKEYRKKVNPKVNVFCIQTAGYKDVLIPELAYRTAIQYGWSGKEAVFAKEYIRQWDEIENK